ncbi:MAG: aminoacetone oxidase family FAD-binding enzyme [Clostridia bacterium]|nr:aminoacetone oxidase family FAD-binding enzyme [Clostridia bacterium]
MFNFKVAVIGGGASGILTAVELVSGKNAFCGKDIAIIERNERIGKKLIATGNGQGNILNAKINKANYYGDTTLIENFVNGLKEINLAEYFYKLGIPQTESEDGKIYPISKQASAVLDVLMKYLLSKGVNIITGEKVISINKETIGFNLKTENNKYFANKVVVAIGGKAGKHFGTDGTSYSLLTNLGHELTKLYPSLVQIKADLTKIRGLKGIKEKATVYALDGEKVLKQHTGDILFTEYGVSGSSIFQISGHLATAVNPNIRVEFLPNYTLAETEKIIKDKISNCTFMQKEEILCGIVNKKVGLQILKEVKNFNYKEIAYAIKNFNLKVTGSLGFDYAQVTKGGITAKNLNSKTFESNVNNGLYIVGEALNVDGDCGGYNLSFAFYSGITCARDIKDKIN